MSAVKTSVDSTNDGKQAGVKVFRQIKNNVNLLLDSDMYTYIGRSAHVFKLKRQPKAST